MEEEEVWKAVSFAPRYEVSNMGRVRDLQRGVLIKTSIGKSGYEKLNLVTATDCRSFYVHRVVYEAFNGAIPPGMTIDHINFKPSDNRLSNLRCIPQELNIRRRNTEKYKHFMLCLDGTEFSMSFDSISSLITHLYSTCVHIPIGISNLRRTLYSRISAGEHSYHIRDTSLTIKF